LRKRRGKISSISDLLSRQPAARAVRTALDAQQQRLAWLRDILPAELGAQLTGAVERRGTLIVYASTAAWCARLRYALSGSLMRCQEHEPTIRALQVRVRPPGSGVAAGPLGRP
jgi:hypothetical protein